jgi:hypothetical protein
MKFLKVYKLFFLLHLLVIACVSSYMSIDSYCAFYDQKVPSNVFVKGMRKTLESTAFEVYGKYTGAETGYGFYAPNVISGGFLEFTKNGERMKLPIHNYENSIRFMNLSTSFVQQALRSLENREKRMEKLAQALTAGPDEMELILKEVDEIKTNCLDSAFFDLLARNMSTKFMKDFASNDTLSVKLKIYDYPTLADYKLSYSTPQYLTAYEKKYFVQN